MDRLSLVLHDSKYAEITDGKHPIASVLFESVEFTDNKFCHMVRLFFNGTQIGTFDSRYFNIIDQRK